MAPATTPLPDLPAGPCAYFWEPAHHGCCLGRAQTPGYVPLPLCPLPLGDSVADPITSCTLADLLPSHQATILWRVRSTGPSSHWAKPC
jgi:hypothetical protein